MAKLTHACVAFTPEYTKPKNGVASFTNKAAVIPKTCSTRAFFVGSEIVSPKIDFITVVRLFAIEPTMYTFYIPALLKLTRIRLFCNFL